MAEDSKRLSMADEGASFTYAAPKDVTIADCQSGLAAAMEDRARRMQQTTGGGERKFTRSEVLTVLKALHAAGAGFPEYIAAFTKME